QAKAANVEDDRAYYAQAAAALEEIAGEPVRMVGGWMVGGSWRIVRGLSFYLPDARILRVSDPADAWHRAEIDARGIAIICSADDGPCLASGATFAARSRTADVTVTPTFLGFAGPPSRYRIIVVPARRADAPKA